VDAVETDWQQKVKAHLILQRSKVVQQSCNLVPLPCTVEATNPKKADKDVAVVEEKCIDALFGLWKSETRDVR
jgi:hypothetical protein